MKAEDYLNMPDRINNIIPVNLPAKAKKEYELLEKDLL